MKRIANSTLLVLLVSHIGTLARAQTYSSNFAGTENPLSEGGQWINGGTGGNAWNNCRKTPGLVFGTEPGTVNYDDTTCVLTGSWGWNQTAQATVAVVNSDSTQFEEVELRLNTSISFHSITGYEINCSVKPGNPYMQIVRWDGEYPLGTNYTQLDSRGVGCRNGDVFKVTNVAGKISAYLNGVLQFSVNDTKYQNGAPGVGFYIQGGTSATNADFGFSTLSVTGASTGIAPPTNFAAAVH